MSITSLSDLKEKMINSESGLKGIREVETVFTLLSDKVPNLVFNINLARGLNYYTGCIFEVVLDQSAYPDIKMGSLGGGGRYDDLTGTFGMTNMSGVGVSFGAERIYIVMDELGLFPENVDKDLQLFFVALDDESFQQGFQWLYEARKAGIRADMYPEPAKMKKQMKYANDRKVPYVAIIGEEERKQLKVALKNMETGEQKLILFTDLLFTPPGSW
jgi:histidyl-tRNA synthetase